MNKESEPETLEPSTPILSEEKIVSEEDIPCLSSTQDMPSWYESSSDDDVSKTEPATLIFDVKCSATANPVTMDQLGSQSQAKVPPRYSHSEKVYNRKVIQLNRVTIEDQLPTSGASPEHNTIRLNNQSDLTMRLVRCSMNIVL